MLLGGGGGGEVLAHPVLLKALLRAEVAILDSQLLTGRTLEVLCILGAADGLALVLGRGFVGHDFCGPLTLGIKDSVRFYGL